MKEGYIVWNQSISGCGYEFFGVYRTLEKAQKILDKIRKSRYGDMTPDEIEQYETDNGDSIQITHFEDTKGITHNINKGD